MISSQSPINISSQNIYGKCDLKCAYFFKYQNSSCSATNNNTMLILSYDKNSSPPVTYNNNKYEVSQIQICAPSFHLFNDSKTVAEIMIYHAPILGGKELVVCVPIIQSNNSSVSSILLSDIITAISGGAPKNGDSMNINLTGYTLQNIIPKKPFYTYTTNNNDYIVFDKENSIGISADNLKILTSVIKQNVTVAYGDNIFYNNLGPNTTNGQDNDIYISCQPTGNSEENITVTNSKPIINNDVYANFPMILIFVLIFIITLIIINYMLTYLGKNKMFNK